MINSKTKIACLIGSPVSHSLSPIIHNSIYQLTNKNMVYLSFDIKNNELDKFIDSVRALDIKGFNITMPHKEATIDFVDDILDNHKSINTVKHINNKLIATSTDSLGFLYLLEANNIDIKDKNIVIIGAGATSNIVIKSIKNKSIKDNSKSNITITARDEDKLESIAKLDNINFIPLKNIQELSNIDILINTTPLGMHAYKYNFENFNFLSIMNKYSTVIDSIYNPWQTALLENAKKLELHTYNGIDMLLGQAIASHEFWFDENLGLDIVEQVKNILYSHVY